MSEEKLTVADLLARRQKEGATSEEPRRRRRRSLEEGGVSVQELTGSIPRVKAGEPRRGAHALSNSDDDQTRPEDLRADDADVAAADKTAPAAEVETDAPDVADTSAQGESVEVSPGESETAEAETAETVEATETSSEHAAESDDQNLAESNSVAATESVEEAAAPAQATETPAPEQQPAATAQPVPPAQAPTRLMPPMAVPLEPRPVMVNSKRSEITYTFTDLRDVTDDSRIVGTPGPMARAALTGSNSYDDRPTATIPVITDDIVAENTQHAESTESVGRTVSQPEQTDEFPAVPDDAAAAVETRSAHAGEAFDSEDGVAGRQVTEEAVGSAPEDVVKPNADSGAVADEAQDIDRDVAYAEDNSLSVPLLLVQVLVGLIAGAMVFLGFTMAWSSLPRVVVVIMAVVVTVLLVVLANYVRRKKDRLTPILAGAVGLALTFGPWLLFKL